MSDERSVRKVAVLLAVAAHLFFFVWLLRDYHPNAVALSDPPAFVLVDVYRMPTRLATNLRSAENPSKKSTTSAASRAARSVDKGGNVERASNSATPITQATLAAGLDSRDATAMPSAGNARFASGSVGNRVSDGGGAAHAKFLPPKVLRKWVGDYPASAFAEHAQGRAQVLVTISADGRLVDARVASSSGNAALDDASIATVQHYSFRAGERDGIAEQMDAYIDIHWTITPSIVRRFSTGEVSIALPMSLSAKRVKTRFGSYLETAKLDSEQNSAE